MSITPVTGDIIVGVDGSPASLAALRWAAAAAARHGRALRLVHAFAWPAYAASYGLPPAAWAGDELRREAEAVLATAAAQAHELVPRVPVHGMVVQGTPAAVLTAASRTGRMVVLGSRGTGGFTGLLLGSVSSQVSRHAVGVIVVVPVHGEPPDQVHPRVVVGTDGSAAAEPAVGYAFEEAAKSHATLQVIHAWLPPAVSRPDAYDPRHELRAELEAAEAEFLADAIRPWEAKYPQLRVERLVVAEHPVHALTTAAKGANLLVVGSRGHGGFRGLHLGSISQQVLHHAPGPVAVVRPTHHEYEDAR